MDCSFFIVSNETAITYNIGTWYRCKFPLEALGTHRVTSKKHKSPQGEIKIPWRLDIETFFKPFLIDYSRRFKVYDEIGLYLSLLYENKVDFVKTMFPLI
jgi:hypothetical protein